MTSTYFAKRVKGATKLRRTLNRLEPESKKRIQEVIRMGAVRIKVDAIGIAVLKDIKLTGDMIESIDYSLSADKLVAVIGPGARSARVRRSPFNTTALTAGLKSEAVKIKHKDAQWNLMKAWWAEFGTGPPIPQDPQPFMNPAYDKNKSLVIRSARKTINVALRRAAGGR